MGGRDHFDPVMLELFRAEMETHLPALSQGLLTVEKGQAGEKDFEAMMRAAHSIKGAARIVGIDAAVRVAHAMEDCFSAAQGQRLTLNSESVDVLLQGVDALQRICVPQSESQAAGESIETLLEQITAVREGRASAVNARPAASEIPRGDADVLTRTAESPQRCVALPGRLDDRAAGLFRTQIAAILQESPSRLVLDFTSVQYISAGALHVLASVAREIAQHEPAIEADASGLSVPLAALLRITGLDRTFNLQ